MGKRGPKPTPTPLLLKKGSPKATRPNRRAEAKAKASKTTVPRWMSKEEKAVWRRVVPLLEESGLLATIDEAAVGRYCTNWVRWLKVRAEVLKDGETIIEHRTEYSITKVNPAAQAMHTIAAELHKLEAMFGMSPADRAGLAPSTDKEDEADPFVRLAKFGDKQTA